VVQGLRGDSCRLRTILRRARGAAVYDARSGSRLRDEWTEQIHREGPQQVVSARVSEVISGSFRMNENALRDLDAIVRSRCQEIVASPKLTYEVVRADSLAYESESIDDILNERNTPQTRIRSITLKVTHDPAIALRLEFR
jgi:hypothetical protein